MSRYDKEDLSGLNIPEKATSSTTLFGLNGKEVQSDDRYGVFAKVVTTNDGEKEHSRYYVLVGRGEMIDPYQVDSSYSRNKINNMYKFKKVSKKAFENYIKYLNTKNRLYFTNSRRMIME